ISWPALLMAMLWIVLTSFHPVFYIPWVWAMLKFAGPLPFISYNGAVEFYMGWRPASGGFGTKIVLHND
ncbi:hypothetical protein, partial [Streptococcus pneumoniae]